MGTTSKPLKIVAFGGVETWPEILKLKDQGHEVVTTPDMHDLANADIILGPTAHRMSEDERKWLDDALSEARRRRYPSSH